MTMSAPYSMVYARIIEESAIGRVFFVSPRIVMRGQR
jgi:hypothetical protein